MKTLHTEIDIEAPPETVWRVLTDFGRYGEWNPFIPRLEGTLAPGNRLTVRLTPPGGRAMTFHPTVLAAERDRAFRWKGHLLIPGLFDGEHAFHLEPRNGGTHFVHSEQFSGLLVPLLARSLDTHTRAGFEAMNEALKARAEARAHTRSGR